MSVVPASGVISLARGVPSPEMFPVDDLLESSRHAIVNDASTALNYGEPFGYLPLRQVLADEHGVAPEQVVVMPGSLIGLNFLVSHFFVDGGRALVEAPTYDRMIGLLRESQVTVESVRRTDGGLDLDVVREAARRAPQPAFLYVLPTFHNPTGHTLSLDDRCELVELALEYELLVVEDDPYGRLRIDGEPLPRVHDLFVERGGADLAIFSSTFSKTIAPGVRVGYLILPPRLVAPIQGRVTRAYVSPPLLAQAQVYEFLSHGYFDSHLESLRSTLRARRDALLEVLTEELGDVATWTRPEGGYFVWLELPGGVDSTELNERARGEGVEFVPGSGFYPDARGASFGRLAYSFPSVEEIREGARRLSSLVLAST
jgi:DNA-binding transcriptional MocR family regulator